MFQNASRSVSPLNARADSLQNSINLNFDKLKGINVDGIIVQIVGDPKGNSYSLKNLLGDVNSIVNSVVGDVHGVMLSDTSSLQGTNVDNAVLCTTGAIQPPKQTQNHFPNPNHFPKNNGIQGVSNGGGQY